MDITIHQKMAEEGLIIDQIICDGKIQRCGTQDHPRKKNAWYIIHPSGNGATVGDWSQNTSKYISFRAEKLSENDRKIITRERNQSRRDIAKKQKDAANQAFNIYEKSLPAQDHPYLTQKQTPAVDGLKIFKQSLIVPVFIDNNISSLQFIQPDGSKRFLSKGVISGGYFQITGTTEKIYICEGLATGISIFLATKNQVIVAFNAGNLDPVARLIKDLHPDKKIIIAGDDDCETEDNPGQKAATSAAKAINSFYVISDLGQSKSDFNDVYVKSGIDVARQQLENFSPATPPPAKNTNGYYSNPDGIFFVSHDKNGNDVRTQLTNFQINITGELVRDDGENQNRYLEMTYKNGRQHNFTIPSKQFNALQWLPELCGSDAIVMQPGNNTRDRVRIAIQTLSNNKKTETVYVHLGWRKISGAWYYLHSGGAIGANGHKSKITTDLEGPKLTNFNFNPPPPPEILKSYCKTAIQFFNNLPETIRWSLFLIPFRAVLSEVDPPETSPFLEGQTGMFKSEIAALLQSFFGVEMADKRRLPANWSSTANSIEFKSFLAKDALLVIDDLAYCGNATDIAILNRTAERVFRSAGNRSGRQRMTPDGGLRPTYYPRGLTMATGEDLPPGKSLRARLLIIEIKKDAISTEILTHGQQLSKKGIFNSLLSAFIQYLASRIDHLKKIMPERKIYFRQNIDSKEGHNRNINNIADLLATAEIVNHFFDKMTGIPAFDLTEVSKNLVDLFNQQETYQENVDPCQRFFDLLRGCLLSGKAHLTDPDLNDQPVKNESWGNGNGDKIGWLFPGHKIYLQPDATFSAIQEMARKQGQTFPNSPNRLFKTLRERGLSENHERNGNAYRNTARVRINGTLQRVLQFDGNLIFDQQNAY